MENQTEQKLETATALEKKYAYVLHQDLMKAVVEYMVKRPYAEVFQVLDELRKVPGQEIPEQVTTTEVAKAS